MMHLPSVDVLFAVVALLAACVSVWACLEAREAKRKALEAAETLQPSDPTNPRLVIAGAHTADDVRKAWEADRRARKRAVLPGVRAYLDSHPETTYDADGKPKLP